MELIKYRIYLSDLTDNKIDEIKEDIKARLYLNEDLISEIKGKIKDEYKESEIESELTDTKMEWEVSSKLDDEVDDILINTAYAEIEVGE